MRRHFWILAFLALAGCSRAGDPVVGKWMEAKAHAMRLEFSADGTVVHDMDFSDVLAKSSAKYPHRAESYRTRLDKARKDLRAQKATWTRKRGLYQVTTQTSLRKEPVASYYRIEGSELLLCKEDGSPLTTRFVRQTQ